jgi:hypothetical protein
MQETMIDARKIYSLTDFLRNYKVHRESRQGTGGFSRLGNAFLSAEGVFPPCDFLSVFVKQLTFR